MVGRSSSNNPSVVVEVGEEYYPSYPYPSHVSAPNFVTVKLSGMDKYGMWKTQMLCLLASHSMLGFINGKFPSPDQKGKMRDMDAWVRSDALVKAWILGSISHGALGYVLDRLTSKLTNADFTAKDLWDELQIVYEPAITVVLPRSQALLSDKEQEEKRTREAQGSSIVPLLSEPNSIVPKDAESAEVLSKERVNRKKEERGTAKLHPPLYDYTLIGDWIHVKQILDEGEVRITDKITTNGNTALHVAVETSLKREFLEKLLELTPKEDHALQNVRNSDGSTLLHVAAIVDNSEAATMLVKRDRALLFAEDNEGHTPLAIALSNMHTHTSNSLLDQMTQDEQKIMFSGTSGDELLVTIISSKNFRLAQFCLDNYSERLHSDAVLMAIAQNFPSKPNVWERGIGKFLHRVERAYKRSGSIVCTLFPSCPRRLLISWCKVKAIFPRRLYSVMHAGFKWIKFLFPMNRRMLVLLHSINGKYRLHKDAIQLVDEVCRSIRYNIEESSTHPHYYKNPILEATSQNAYEVVQGLVDWFSDAIWSRNEDGHNFIQYAVIKRSESVYNLIYQMSEHRNIYRTIKDSSGNNLLHLAARLAPTDKLNLISGAALQIQRELQWYKEVEAFVCPLNIIQKNSAKETPKMVFTREHGVLVIEGEKWMKTAAESYSITAALITTIAFAAAITVPGGNNQDKGIPIFTNTTAFTVFAISDAISLFASVTSLLVFLSILTTRFAEQDFLFKLPTKLIVGLATLFISTTAMIVAFGATLYLVFGHRSSWILIPISVLTCLPITSFVTLQFPLLKDLVSATYCHSIFGKQGYDYFY